VPDPVGEDRRTEARGECEASVVGCAGQRRSRGSPALRASRRDRRAGAQREPASHPMIHAARLNDHGRHALTSHKVRMRLEEASGVPGDPADLRESRALLSRAGVRTGVGDFLLRSKPPQMSGRARPTIS